MKSKLYLLGFLFFIAASCGKKTGHGDPVVKKAVHIQKALFTDPAKVKTVSSSTVIMDELIKYFDHAPAGSKIHFSIFGFSYQPLIDAIKRAQQRGVEINAMIDYSREETIKENAKPIDELRKALRSPSRVITVKSDAGSSSINHHKHALFSEVNLPEGTAKNVVFSTSHNFSLADTRKVQDAVVISDDGLYNAFLGNWNDMASRAQSGMKNFTYRTYETDSLNAFFFPRRKNGAWDGSDTVIDILNKISDYQNATVQVGMSDWVVSRIITAQKLTELREKGVNVQVIAKDKADPEILDELNKLKSKGGDVKILKMPVNIHSKFILIKGTWDGKPQEILITGTHNFTTNALRNNNEVILLFKNNPLFKDYQDYFAKLKQVL